MSGARPGCSGQAQEPQCEGHSRTDGRAWGLTRLSLPKPGQVWPHSFCTLWDGAVGSQPCLACVHSTPGLAGNCPRSSQQIPFWGHSTHCQILPTHPFHGHGRLHLGGHRVHAGRHAEPIHAFILLADGILSIHSGTLHVFLLKGLKDRGDIPAGRTHWSVCTNCRPCITGSQLRSCTHQMCLHALSKAAAWGVGSASTQGEQWQHARAHTSTSRSQGQGGQHSEATGGRAARGLLSALGNLSLGEELENPMPGKLTAFG